MSRRQRAVRHVLVLTVLGSLSIGCAETYRPSDPLDASRPEAAHDASRPEIPPDVGSAPDVPDSAAYDGGSSFERNASPPPSVSLVDAASEGDTCSEKRAPRAISTVSKRLNVIYLAPLDEPAPKTARRLASLERAFVGIQSYYAEAMGDADADPTFPLSALYVLHSTYTKAEWDDFSTHGLVRDDGSRTADDGGCSMWHGAELELRDHGLLAAAGLPSLDDPDTKYFVLIGAGTNGSCGGGNLAASEGQLLDALELRCPSGRVDSCTADCPPSMDPEFCGDINPCMSVGALAHELGHAFGLPHGSERTGDALRECQDNTVMDRWQEYDLPERPTLCGPDRRDLLRSGFFGT